MNALTWIARVLLGAAFLMAGGSKALQPIETLSQNMDWVMSFPPLMVRLIGLLEVAGIIGLFLPLILKIQPKLAGLAAYGLGLTMVGAAITHLARGEMGMILVNLILLGLAVFVGRQTLKLRTSD